MRTLALLLTLVLSADAAEFGRTLRDLRADDRERRREALDAFAEGRVKPNGRAQTDRLVRGLQVFLNDRFPGVERAKAITALIRIGRPKSVGKILDWLAKDQDDRVTAAAAKGFRGLPDETAEQLVRRIGASKDPLARAVFLRLLGEMRHADARRRIRMRARMGDHWCPRATAAHALANDRHPDSLAALATLLDSEDPGLLTAAFEALTRLTRLKHGRDVVKWKTWWETVDKKKPLPDPPPAKNPDGRRIYAHEAQQDPIRPYYFGIPVRRRTVVFVFDVSASMRYKLPLAFDQLIRAVKALPSSSRFEVIFFNEHVHPWRSRLSHADPVTKELLVRHLKSIEIKSYTNLWDSIEKALELEPDEIFVISDGEPNRGRWRSTRDILRELKKLNTKRVPIHTISVVRTVDGDKHVALLKAIAADHGGKAVQRTLK